MSVRKLSVAVVLAFALVAACQEDPTSTARSTGVSPQSNAAIGTMISRTTPRFAISVQVQGELKPNSPIVIAADTRGLENTLEADVRISAPEVEAARRSSWDRNFRVQANRHLPGLTERRVSLGRSQTEHQQATITVGSPGYYRIVATAKAVRTEPRRRGAPLTDDFASRELWLGITPEGGRVTDSFEENLFPDSAYKQPGPIRYRRTGKEASGTAGSKIASMMSPGTRTWEVLYYNQDVSGYVPLIGAQAIGTEGLVGEDPTPLWETTDVNGEFVTGCDHDEFYAYSFDIKAENSAVRIKPNTVVASEASAPAGCTDQQIITLSIPSHVFSRMRATVTTSIDFFGQSTALIPVGIDTTAANSYYFPTQDSISIKHIWGTTAREIQVHEYGHAYQDLTLGGIPTLEQPICSNHGTPVYTTLKCAYAEGFAEYFAAAILGSGVSVEYSDFEAGYDLLTNSNDSTADSNYPDPNGARVEGAVAAMFLDLTDPANETHDDVQFPGSYIASLIETCSVNYGGGSEPGTGVDHFIRCLEKQLDSGISSLFWPRTATPTSYSESATEPGSWNLTKIRTLWLKNLYDQ